MAKGRNGEYVCWACGLTLWRLVLSARRDTHLTFLGEIPYVWMPKHGLENSCQHNASSRLPERAHPVPSHRAFLRVGLHSNVCLDTVADSPTRAPPVSIDQVVSDFDNVAFHVSTPESKTKILISITLKCYRELLQYGAQEVLEREYGPYTAPPEAGYDFSVLIDLENLPADQGEHLREQWS